MTAFLVLVLLVILLYALAMAAYEMIVQRDIRDGDAAAYLMLAMGAAGFLLVADAGFDQVAFFRELAADSKLQ